MISKRLEKRPKVCKIEQEIWKKMLKNSRITPLLRFKQQQNITQSHFPPIVTVFGKKWDNLRLMLQSSLWMKYRKFGEFWKELGPQKRMQPTGIFSENLFRSYSSLKMTCLKINVKTAASFVISDSRFLKSWLQQAAISKRF